MKTKKADSKTEHGYLHVSRRDWGMHRSVDAVIAGSASVRHVWGVSYLLLNELSTVYQSCTKTQLPGARRRGGRNFIHFVPSQGGVTRRNETICQVLLVTHRRRVPFQRATLSTGRRRPSRK